MRRSDRLLRLLPSWTRLVSGLVSRSVGVAYSWVQLGTTMCPVLQANKNSGDASAFVEAQQFDHSN